MHKRKGFSFRNKPSALTIAKEIAFSLFICFLFKFRVHIGQISKILCIKSDHYETL